MIKFGTDGWRARLAADFTFENVRLVTQALVDFLKAQGLDGKGIAVGYDNRFQSEDFARTAAEVCSGAGLKTLLMAHSLPSPALSYTVNHLDLGAGIMITASHNPPDWNGFKIKENFGGSAFPETTKAVEANLATAKAPTGSDRNITLFDPDPDYLAKVGKLADLARIKAAPLNIVVDPMHGSGAGYFSKLGLEVTEIRGWRDPLFSGINPEPLPVNLEESFSLVREAALQHPDRLTVGIVLDGDADRIAAIDADGRFINTHNIFCLLLYHLVRNRKLTGPVVKTFNLTGLIDKLCRSYGLPLTVTPIGFKYIAKMMLERPILIGGEESGGMALQGFIPERDGTVAGLALLELMATEKKTLGQILDGLMAEHGYYYYDRIDRHTDQAQALVGELKKHPPQELAGLRISKVEDLDGLKFYFEDDSWVLFRASGTEPLLRIYCEGRTPEKLKQILGAAESLVP
ncbi:MAG: phosphoglucomutase/phosphomannomutase family protein [Candidatus Margulisbacteria bacterium]|jgi:phosphomannomutase|nr:phosphoglucomutase/phosphomannomutase family protein [Candidatus Margulisiibacteriota bacterium]